MKINSESPLLAKREREFLRPIALKLREDADRRWQDLPTDYKRAIEETFAKREER